MRTNLAIVAGLAACSAIGLAPQVRAAELFKINASSPGSMTFSGQGTAQFNNSLGSNNSFQVGSSTNLGVSASSSSTPEYGVAATAQLDLAGASRLTQVIGTSGNDATRSRTHERAHTNSRDVLSSRGWGASYETSSNKADYADSTAWQAGYEAAYQSEYKNAYTAANAVSNETNANGTISGAFKTVETGRSSVSGSTGDWEGSAQSAVEVSHGADYENRSSTYTATSEADWEASRSTAYDAAYARAAANSNRTSDSTVEVKGIGSDASLQAADTSTFKVTISATNEGGSSTATSNGSAGANLATSSFANQSNASTASGFMQAFGGSVTPPGG